MSAHSIRERDKGLIIFLTYMGLSACGGHVHRIAKTCQGVHFSAILTPCISSIVVSLSKHFS